MSKTALGNKLIAYQEMKAPEVPESKDKHLATPCGDVGGDEEILNFVNCDEDKVVEEVAVEYPENIQAIMSSLLTPIGMDVHPFLIGWYNEKVGPRFQLNYSPITLAFVVISGPDCFEKCVVPYAQLHLSEDPTFSTMDPLDDSMRHAFSVLQEDLLGEGLVTEVFHDFDMWQGSRRPKVLVQTAAHVAGACQYLQKRDLPKNVQDGPRFAKKSNLSGVAIHPRYGGWYAIRGIVVFTNVRLPEGGQEIERPEPLKIFKDEELITKTIELFAYNWQSNEWRNMHLKGDDKLSGEDKQTSMTYSDNFVRFLEMETGKRWEFVKQCCGLISQEGDKENDKQEKVNKS